LLIRGGIIGLAISAPVGPIGILCIQRTLSGGRIVGLVTGLGAATADAFYGAIAALGMAYVADILVSQQNLLRLLGGGFLVFLGIRIFVSKPAEKSSPSGKEGLAGAYASTFVLTLTNPVTIIFFAAIFAGVGGSATDGSLFSVLPLVLGVFLGSALWWLLLSGGVSLLRDRVTPRSMRWINRAAGLIIALFGASAIIASFST
jgi:threonine/homoserine/homoserine lactone efflux protein